MKYTYKESGGGGEEGDGANTLTPDETYDAVRSGARLILDYDAASNSFRGTLENTTQGALDRVRIEVHLSNGAELGPTTPTDMAPGEMMEVNCRRLRRRSPDGRLTPRLAEEAKGASRAASMVLAASMGEAGSPTGSTGKAAKAERSRPGDNVKPEVR